MTRRATEHDRREMWDAKCAMCGKMARVPWDPKKDPRRVLCSNCRAIMSP